MRQTPASGPNDTRLAPLPVVTFPVAGTYTFAGRTTPVVILGLAPRNELRIIDADGCFRTVAEHRIRWLS